MEMRKVKYLLDYNGAREAERARSKGALLRAKTNYQLKEARDLAQTSEELDESTPHEEIDVSFILLPP